VTAIAWLTEVNELMCLLF